MTTYVRRIAQRARLLRDGRKALKLISAGADISTTLMAVSSSRARLYRAMNYAQSLEGATDDDILASIKQTGGDPLLL